MVKKVVRWILLIVGLVLVVYSGINLYKIFSDGACDTIVDTGITVNNILSKKITITDIYFTTGSKTCTESTIESFTMSINSQPTGDVSTAILKQNSSNIIY